MAKGKKNVLRADKKPEDSAEDTVTSLTETKENKPANNKGCKGNVQTVLPSLWTPSKPRSPLSDSSSTLIQEGNDLDSTKPDMPRLKKGSPNKIKAEVSKVQKAEMACHSDETREKASEQPSSTSHTDVRSATDGSVPKSKSQGRNGRKLGAKKMESKALQNRKVTDYFPIRRSNRKTNAELKIEQHKHLDDLIKNGIEEGMQVKNIDGKGRGVFAVSGFKRGDFVVEYHGDLLDLAEAKIREAQYAEDPQTGCYMYYFQYQSKTYCVDATKETSRLGRLINHSKTGNCQTRLHPIDGTPHLILVASKDIDAGEELLYDYGDRSKASILAHPWLKH
ncbi:lysine methyltransferase 5Ab [Oreochromis niloticus]|nr:N-lysine methyltransferase KMT5A [Oreochromis niloticus]CAI5650246.1 unnamed protein product [Mustela putorius furo]